MCLSIIEEYLRETLWRSPEFSFCAVFFSPLFCSLKSSCLGFTGHSDPLITHRRLLSYLSCINPGNSMQQARVFIGLTLFPISQWSLSFIVWCPVVLKIVASYIVPSFLVVSDGECISGPCFSILIRSRSLIPSFLNITHSPSNFLV